MVLLLLISVTGHLGGNLTHGSDYLTAYSPFRNQNKKTENNIASNPNSVIVFKHLIQPILKAKCIDCHNKTKSNGGLLLTTQEGLNKDGNNGRVLTAFQPYKSELFLRSTITRLNLSNSGISDQGILEIKKLKHLEVLNVYGTNITDKSIQVFKALPSLKRLYLWGQVYQNQLHKH